MAILTYKHWRYGQQRHYVDRVTGTPDVYADRTTGKAFTVTPSGEVFNAGDMIGDRFRRATGIHVGWGAKVDEGRSSFIVLQQGGTTFEVYATKYDTLAEAEDAVNSHTEASYNAVLFEVLAEDLNADIAEKAVQAFAEIL